MTQAARSGIRRATLSRIAGFMRRTISYQLTIFRLSSGHIQFLASSGYFKTILLLGSRDGEPEAPDEVHLLLVRGFFHFDDPIRALFTPA
jgi:hypothetical protein